MIRAFVLLVAIVLAGAVGYVLIEGMPIGEALHMSVEVLATLGTQTPYALNGAGQQFTSMLVVLSVGAIVYGVLATLQLALNRLIRRSRSTMD